MGQILAEPMVTPHLTCRACSCEPLDPVVSLARHSCLTQRDVSDSGLSRLERVLVY